MKINLKKKVMLALLAGGMLCMGQGSADNVNVWYGSGSPVAWKYVSVSVPPYPFNLTDACKTGANFTIEDGTMVGGIALGNVQLIYGGHSGGTDLVTGNSITFNTTDTTTINALLIHSGYTANGTAKGNSMTINGGTFSSSSSLCSGYSGSGTAEGNSMTINGGTLAGSAVCGYVDSGNGTVKGNLLTVNSGTFEGPIHGGYINSGNATAEDNLVIINSGTFNNSVYGGYGKSGDAKGNSLNINGGTFNYWIRSGQSNSGDAINNAVTIEDGIFNSNAIVLGGYSYEGKAGGTIPERGNKVTINGGTFNGAKISGATGDSSTAEGNNVTVNGGTFNSDSKIYGGDSYFGAVTNNTVTINGGIFDGTDIYGGHKHFSGSECVQGNILTISAGTFDSSSFYGGYVNGNGSAIGNKIVINGGTFGDNSYFCGGNVNGDGSAIGNEIVINGGTFGADSRFLCGCSDDVGSITENKIMINGGYFGTGCGFTLATSAELNPADGTMTVKGGVFGNSCEFKGSRGGGNTFDLQTVIAGTVAEIKNFQNMNFTIPAGMDRELPMLKVTTSMVLDGVTFNVQNWSDGDYITLVKNVDDASFTPSGNFYVLNIGGTKELVYANGTPTAKGDYTIKQGSKKYDSDATARTYASFVIGNTTDGGLSDTSYSGNEVIIRRGTYNDYISGATTTGNEIVNNIVRIYDGAFNGFCVAGGFVTGTGSARENTVIINGGSFTTELSIYGGYSGGANANNNHITINAGTFNNNDIGAGCTDNGNANGNIVTINGGSFENYGGDKGIYGGCSSNNGSANENKVYVNGGSFSENIMLYGGYSLSSDGASKNYVEINSGSFGNGAKIYGGYTYPGSGNAKGNSVTIKNGTFNDGCEIYVGYTDSGNAEGNSVIIEGGTFGNLNCLAGGHATSGPSTNNTLNLKIKMSGTHNYVYGFQTMNFTLPSNITNGDVMLKAVNLNVDYNNGTATINVNAANGVKLNKDDVITLVDVSDYIQENYVAGDILGGAAEFYSEADAGEDKNGDGDQKDLVITLLQDFEQKKTAGNEDQQKAPVEGIAAAMQTINMSADLASGQGMSSLLANTAGGTTDTFGAMSAGSSKYKTGSHVDVDGWGVLVGAGKKKEWKDGSATTYGLFFEYGKGDFDTYNGNVHGDGNSENKGVGIMARHKLTNNTYYEGNIRYGKQETEWSESELGGYETDSRYYGISVGVGHIYPVGKNEIDVYGRYTYGHVGACDATLKDSKYHFDSVKSHRVRVGGKYNFKVKDSNAKPYVGLAWEHEFKGEARASISGVGEAPAPSMKGNTGIMEVGCDWKVSKKWTVGLGANAYIGKRKGWDGMARVFYNF